MMVDSKHYKTGQYIGGKPYRDYLIEALQYFDITSLTHNQITHNEFWTLGGMEWAEYNYLLQNGIEFGQNTYHNVDRGTLNPNTDPRVQAHPNQEFMQIYKLWTNPRVICYDSTEGLATKNENNWIRLIYLGIRAAETSGQVSLNWNYMTSYGTIHWKNQTWDTTLDLYEHWLQMLVDHIECTGLHIEFYGRSILDHKEGSTTKMLSGHCLITK